MITLFWNDVNEKIIQKIKEKSTHKERKITWRLNGKEITTGRLISDLEMLYCGILF